MRTQAAAPRRRSKLSPAARAEITPHPFNRIPGTALGTYGETVLTVKPTTDSMEAWDQGALLGLRMLDAVQECHASGRFLARPADLLKLLATEAAAVQPSEPASWRFQGFVRVLEMVLNGYARHSHHGHDAPHVIGLEHAWLQWSGRVVQ